MNSTRLYLRLRLPTPSTPLHTLSRPSPARAHPIHIQRNEYSISRLPRIAQASVWTSLIPKFLRKSPSNPSTSAPLASKEWNPATFYIIIFLLIGSQAIRMIALKNEYTANTRRTDAKIRLLKEVIEKVKAGEQVDVEKLLGRGDDKLEREWEDVLREIEREDSLWHQKQKRGADEAQESERKAVSTLEAEAKSKDPVVPATTVATDTTTNNVTGEPTKSPTKQKLNFF
ncbi:hypothetical protein BJX99DRAFT_218232 [Aspergillus californicus]